MKYIIVAYDKNNLIGGKNSLLWQGEMNADIRRFREKTTGNVIIMGRKTYESIGHPLPNRQNIVITNKPIRIKGAFVVDCLENAYKIAEIGKDIYIIGGGQIYEQTISGVDRILSTEIDAEFDGDVYFPNISNEWHGIEREDFMADDMNKYKYSFITYSRQR